MGLLLLLLLLRRRRRRLISCLNLGRDSSSGVLLQHLLLEEEHLRLLRSLLCRPAARSSCKLCRLRRLHRRKARHLLEKWRWGHAPGGVVRVHGVLANTRVASFVESHTRQHDPLSRMQFHSPFSVSAMALARRL